MRGNRHSGFTLIELSIVLVIIGLIVGGVLVGQDLIAAATIQSQIKQIQQYNLAVNTFKIKYGYLPGDIPDPAATSIGLDARGTFAGEGDGNGVIEEVNSNLANRNNGAYLGGEPVMFWKDLSAANLIPNSFTLASATATGAMISNVFTNSSPAIRDYLPVSKFRTAAYIYVWSGGWSGTDQTNYFGLSIANWISNGGITVSSNDRGLTVFQAYSIDTKIDDGMPMSGNVLATFENGGPFWANKFAGSPGTAVIVGDIDSCFDNNNTSGVQQTYSMNQSGGNANCTLSFRFQ